MAEHGAGDLRAEDRLDERGADADVLAEDADLVGRDVIFAIEAVVIEQPHAAVMHPRREPPGGDLGRRHAEELGEGDGTGAGPGGVGGPAGGFFGGPVPPAVPAGGWPGAPAT